MALSGQRKGGHIMVSFDVHVCCACCCEKGSGTDPCVVGQDDCPACLLPTPEQQKQLAMPTYKICKEKSSKEDLLIDPSHASVVSPVDLNQSVASAVSSPSNTSFEDPSLKKELIDLNTNVLHILHVLKPF